MIFTKTSDEVIEPLMNSAVGVMPTDTVYGLVARAADLKAVERLYALKHREHKPGTVIAASVEQLVELGVEERYLNRAKQWWPGPLSLIVPAGPGLSYLHQERGDFPVRVPADGGLRTLLAKTGPLVTSSANEPGEPTAKTVGEAENYFDDRVDFYVDGGDLSGRQPSTIVRVGNEGEVEVLREGAVKV